MSDQKVEKNADEQKRTREEAGHLILANFCLLLAAVVWFVTVERPRVILNDHSNLF